MYLHNDRELFQEAIYSTSAIFNIPVPVVEKDYYVTMILKLLSEKAEGCVFKGGTSLSKCHHVIKRFSEDIDITFTDKLTQGQRKKLKNIIIDSISKELDLPISDWDKTRSRRDYNCYTFRYDPLDGYIPDSLIFGVKMEVSLASVAFPVIQMPVDSYVYQFLKEENMDIAEEYGLLPFLMTIQDIDRTLADKVFALCDYYLDKKIERNSRHIYDIHKLLPLVEQDVKFKQLIHEVRVIRERMTICPSAKKGIAIPELLKRIIKEDIYRNDYDDITTYFQNEQIDYDVAIESLKQIANSDMFKDEEFE